MSRPVCPPCVMRPLYDHHFGCINPFPYSCPHPTSLGCSAQGKKIHLCLLGVGWSPYCRQGAFQRFNCRPESHNRCLVVLAIFFAGLPFLGLLLHALQLTLSRIQLQWSADFVFASSRAGSMTGSLAGVFVSPVFSFVFSRLFTRNRLYLTFSLSPVDSQLQPQAARVEVVFV